VNFWIAQSLSQNQILHGNVGYNGSYGHFCDFLAYFCYNLVAMATSLDPCNRKCLLWIGRPQKPPVMSNHILVRNALIAIFVPKLVAMATPLCPLCTGVSQMNSQMAQTISRNQTLCGYVAYN